MKLVALALGLVLAAFAVTDPYLWLEEVEGTKALEWVTTHNETSLPVLQNDPRYATIDRQVRDIVLATDRIPAPVLRGGWIYNFWQDAQHVRGLYRRTRPEQYKQPNPKWDVVLDLDELAKKENENWVWKSATCLPPKYEQCLLRLSRGGKDAVVVREFDVEKRAFVTGGFELPEAKSDTAWKDADHLLVGTDFGPGTLTASGYPRLVKLWRRGTGLTEAKLVFEGAVDDVAARGYTIFRPEGNVTLVSRSPDFFTEETSLLDEKLAPVRLPLPNHAEVQAVFDGFLLATLRADWGWFGAGALVALPLDAVGKPDAAARIELVYLPDSRSTLEGLATTKSALYLNLLQNVQGKLVKLTREKSKWVLSPLDFPANGVISVLSSDNFEDRWLSSFQGFLVPPSVYLVDSANKELLKQLPPRFDASPYQVSQWEVPSKDGVKIPYFVVHPKQLKLDGSNPTLLYGYGGFQLSSTPYYLSATGKVWLERGGVYVVANIRGGGEFGPKWHQAALKENRQKAYDDFIAVAQDLIERKISSPRRLGIEGGSNGGLLVGAAFTQRPDLFNAVICQVPLLDMLRFHKLLAGHSWIGEYGNPDDPAMAEIIAKYSPYQNVNAGVRYPKVFFMTSTKDDRVHPGHARKMVARMEELSHEVLYYENIEGGHGGAANLEQRIKNSSLEFTYLLQQLVD